MRSVSYDAVYDFLLRSDELVRSEALMFTTQLQSPHL